MAGCSGPSGCSPSIEKRPQAPFQYGTRGTDVIEIWNTVVMFGHCSGGIVVDDDLPPGITFVAASSGLTVASAGGGTMVTASNDTYGTLGPGECVTLERTVDVASAGSFPTSPPVENCATGTPKPTKATPTDSPTPTKARETDTPTPTKARETDTPTETRG
jgi:hypothetical protein